MDNVIIFRDREDAGRRLAARLADLHEHQPIIIGLPRGGVVVAREVARTLQAPLDVIVVRKLGVPSHLELGFGAISEQDVVVLNDEVINMTGVDDNVLRASIKREREVLDKRLHIIRNVHPQLDIVDRTVIIVDDGLATGIDALAACRVAKARGASRIVLAVPVAPAGWDRMFAREADSCIALQAPTDFGAVGGFYDSFEPVEDHEVLRCLQTRTEGAHYVPLPHAVAIPMDAKRLPGVLTVPREPMGTVIFAHGSGSSHRSARNRFVASRLNDAGFATLLFDLLTDDELDDEERLYDLHLHAQRLVHATAWVRTQSGLETLPVGWYGSSTGAAVAIIASLEPTAKVCSIVSRGGRPDLAEDALDALRVPTLLIVGAHDPHVLALNREARTRMQCRTELHVVPGAGHLFEEPGALDAAARASIDWFTRCRELPHE